MKVLITEKLSEAGLAILRDGLEVEERLNFTPEELPQLLSQVDGLIVRSKTQVDKKALELTTRLKVVGRAGIGFDNIDLDAASRKGIVVTNVPEGSTISACEHTFALMLSLARQIPDAVGEMRAGKWNRSRMGVELHGKTLGIVGFGRIGSEVARRAAAFGMTVICYDPFLSKEKARSLSVQLVTLPELFAQSDAITFHVPLVEATKNMIGPKELASMKKGVLIINCARGGIIQMDALAKAIEAKSIGGAALDVFPEEPPDFSHPLFQLKSDRLLLTPHLGASTAEAQEKVALAIAQQVRRALLEGDFENSVNLPRVAPEMNEKLKPHLKLVERLSTFLVQWARSTQHLEVIFEGEVSRLDDEYLVLGVMVGALRQTSEDVVNYINARLLATERGIDVSVTKRANPERSIFRSSVTLRVKGPGTPENPEGWLSVTGGLGPDGSPRLLSLKDSAVEVPLDGSILIIEHHDRPGVVGRVGTILGNSKVNIGRMEVCRRDQGGRAMMILTVDHAVKERVLDNIRELEEIASASTVALGNVTEE